jgi:hypothetical protein
MSHPISRLIGPGHRTCTGRPAIRDATDDSRRSLPWRSRRSSDHQTSAAASVTAALSFTQSGVVGYARFIADPLSARTSPA